MNPFDLNTFLTTIVGGLVTYGLIGIRRINQKLSDLNGTVRELKIWKEDHGKQDDERNINIQHRLDKLEDIE